MNVEVQIGLLIGAIEDYRSDLMSLNALRGKIQGILDILDDPALEESIGESMSTIYEISADEQNDYAWYKKNGIEIVEEALSDIIVKISEHLSLEKTRK